MGKCTIKSLILLGISLKCHAKRVVGEAPSARTGGEGAIRKAGHRREAKLGKYIRGRAWMEAEMKKRSGED